MINLKGKRVVITGAGRGLGRDIAEGFATAGAAVVGGARTTEEIEAVAEAIRALGGIAHAVPVDVADRVSADAFVAAAQQALHGIDVIINCAGIARSHRFENHPDELWHRTLDVNLTGVYHICNAAVPLLLTQEDGGRIINIASIAGKVGAPYVAAYTASKHGVLGLTRALASELAPRITVNAICPGYVDTPMTAATIDNISRRTGRTPAEARAALVRDNPQRRLIDPAEITALALFLAGDQARGINGQAINVDGGTVAV